jgi:hypothetical protein
MQVCFRRDLLGIVAAKVGKLDERRMGLSIFGCGDGRN